MKVLEGQGKQIDLNFIDIELFFGIKPLTLHVPRSYRYCWVHFPDVISRDT